MTSSAVTTPSVDSTDGLQESLQQHGYIADRALAMSLFLALRLGKPLLLEGEAGVGKTEVARVLAALLDTNLIRMQCYEGLDVHHALYEWNYARQILEIRLREAEGAGAGQARRDIFTEDFLIRRPLLQALTYSSDTGARPVLLIDEIDRADEEFEAFLLEFLSDFQITIPELGTLSADMPPVVVITSNRTRELHDALKRRCLYHWIDYPSVEKERQIIRARLPEAPEEIAAQVSAFMRELRQMSLYKTPGVAEALDWAAALGVLGEAELRPRTVQSTLGVLLKHQEDIDRVLPEVERLTAGAVHAG